MSKSNSKSAPAPFLVEIADFDARRLVANDACRAAAQALKDYEPKIIAVVEAQTRHMALPGPEGLDRARDRETALTTWANALRELVASLSAAGCEPAALPDAPEPRRGQYQVAANLLCALLQQNPPISLLTQLGAVWDAGQTAVTSVRWAVNRVVDELLDGARQKRLAAVRQTDESLREIGHAADKFMFGNAPAFRPTFGTRQPAESALTERPKSQRRSKSAVDKKQEARNKWLYNQCCKGKTMPYDKIKAELKVIAPKRGWEVIYSIQGIRNAAIEWAKKNGRDPIPSRQNL